MTAARSRATSTAPAVPPTKQMAVYQALRAEIISGELAPGTTLVIVTHEIGFAREVADTVVFMNQGRVLESGPPEKLLHNPDHPRIRDFLAKVL